MIFNKVKKGISMEKNKEPLKPFTIEEIWLVVKDMAPLKVLGLDGFPTLFYQKY